MKRFLLASIALFFFFNLNAQKFKTAYINIDSASFRINFSPLTFAFGPGSSNMKSELTEPSEFILANNRPIITMFAPDLQFIFKDKIGFDIGLEYYGRTIDDKKIRADFQSHVTDYKIFIEKDNNETGDSPFSTGYDFRLFKAGIVGFIPHKKIVFIPSVDFLSNIESWYPSLKVQFTQPISNYTFTREYKFQQANSVGLKFGCGLRGNIKLNEKSNHSRITMETRIEFAYLKLSGLGYYTDKDISGNELKSSSNKFTQNLYSINLSFTIAGIDFHWK